jgi:hypothetical protein
MANKSGENYRAGVYFAETRGSSRNEYVPVSELSQFADDFTDEEIIHVELWKTKLDSNPFPTAWKLFHTWVVLETKEWYWSFEKEKGGVYVQRSKSKTDVNDWAIKSVGRERNPCLVRRSPRYRIEKRDGNRIKMSALLSSLYTSNQVGSHYDYLKNNCKDFAKFVFDETAEGSAWSWGLFYTNNFMGYNDLRTHPKTAFAAAASGVAAGGAVVAVEVAVAGGAAAFLASGVVAPTVIIGAGVGGLAAAPVLATGLFLSWLGGD